MDSRGVRRVLLLAGACMLAAPVAQADAKIKNRALYPSRQVRDVASSNLWSESSETGGLCIEMLTCPSITNSWQPETFLRTEASSLTGVGARVSGTWESRSFRYRGVKGRRPAKLFVKLGRRTDDATLLQATGNSASFTVEIVKPRTGKAAAEPVPNARLSHRPNFVTVGPKRVDPFALKVGRRYQFRITSTFVNGAQVVPDATADYDRIRLIAIGKRKRR